MNEIEITPLKTVSPRIITVPGSKSITNRALILSIQVHAQTLLKGALRSEDTEVMLDAIQQLGIPFQIIQDSQEVSNQDILIQGLGETPPKGGTQSHPLKIDIKNSGTSARFLMAYLAQSQGGFYCLTGSPRMCERPQEDLMGVLRQLGAKIYAKKEGQLPILIESVMPLTSGKNCFISQKKSSQFASALLLSSQKNNWKIQTEEPENAYVKMTRQMTAEFPKNGGIYQIEPDASGGSYFWAVNNWSDNPEQLPVRVANWPKSEMQIDTKFPGFLKLPKEISRENDLGDSILTAMVLAPFADKPVLFKELERLRLQECDRVKAVYTELKKCGCEIKESGNTLQIFPSKLTGAKIETYNDHRIAMAFAILGLKVAGITIKNPECVNKTFPDFFDKLRILQ